MHNFFSNPIRFYGTAAEISATNLQLVDTFYVGSWVIKSETCTGNPRKEMFEILSSLENSVVFIY